MDNKDSKNGLSLASIIVAGISAVFMTFGFVIAVLIALANPYAPESSYTFAGLMMMIALGLGIVGIGLGWGALCVNTNKLMPIIAICIGGCHIFFVTLSLAIA